MIRRALTRIRPSVEAAIMNAINLRIGMTLISVLAFALLTATQEAPTATKQGDSGHDAVREFRQSSESNHWELGLTTTDADISPDDRLLAVMLETPGPRGEGHARAVESVQVWDYREGRKINSVELATYPKIAPAPNVVRFTADGSLLVASEPTRLHVLDASSLTSLRVIEPPLSQDSRIFHIETAPVGHVVIVGANWDVSGVLFVYDLDTGRLLFQSELPHGISSIAWKQDGTQFAVASPFLCTGARDTVHVFSTNPWSHQQTLSARNPVSLAFSQKHLFLVESGWCKGSVFARHLGLESFDTSDWHRQKTLLLHTDIHDSVSFADGRLLADTGELKTEHDWLDGTTWGVPVDVQFTVWKGETPSLEFTSPSWAVQSRRRSRGCLFRLSRTGKTVLLCPQNPRVFQIP
jgi:WD40 repeat protein